MWGQKAKTRNWCWRKNWCHRKNHLFAPDPPTPNHSVSSQGLRIPPQSLVSACPRFLLWNFISTWTEESVFCFHDQYEMMGERRKWCKKRTISWLMKQELTWDKAFTESTRLLCLLLVFLSIWSRARWFLWNVSASSHMTSVTQRNILDPMGVVGDCSYTPHNNDLVGWISK